MDLRGIIFLNALNFIVNPPTEHDLFMSPHAFKSKHDWSQNTYFKFIIYIYVMNVLHFTTSRR